MNLKTQLRNSGAYGPVRIRHCNSATIAEPRAPRFGSGDPLVTAYCQRLSPSRQVSRSAWRTLVDVLRVR